MYGYTKMYRNKILIIYSISSNTDLIILCTETPEFASISTGALTITIILVKSFGNLLKINERLKVISYNSIQQQIPL